MRLEPQSRQMAVRCSVKEELRAPQQIVGKKRKYHQWSEADKVMALQAAAIQGTGAKAVVVRNLQLNFPARVGGSCPKIMCVIGRGQQARGRLAVGRQARQVV